MIHSAASEHSDFLYIRIAERIERMIEKEVLKIGEKLPSVRNLSEEQGVSMGTVFQAYYHLEAKGLIEARPKSGYYVRFSPREFPKLPRVGRPAGGSRHVSVAEMIAEVFHELDTDEVLNFALAAPSLDLLPTAKLNKAVMHALRQSPHHGLNYENTKGNADLRRQLARLALNWGVACGEEDVVVTAGCTEALVLSLKAVTQPGDTVAVESPTYFGIFQVMESLGLKVVEIPADSATGPDLDILVQALDRLPIRACLFVPNFNNPLGSCMPDERKEALVNLLTDRGIPLIEDDIYGELYFGKQRPRPCKAFDREDTVIYCSSLSKSLAPGYRIGWTIAGPYTPAIVHQKLIYSVSTNTLAQAATAHFLAVGRYELHLRRLRKALHTQALRYVRAIREHFPAGTRVSRPQGGFVLWIELPAAVDAYQLHQEAKKYEVSVAPGQIFSLQGNYTHYIRIGYGRPWDTKVEEGLRLLGKLVAKLVA